MRDTGEVEILESGGRQESRLRGLARRLEPRLTRRAQVVLLLAALVLGTVGVVVDRQVRADEKEALDACAVETEAAVRRASGLIGYMVGYVRPTMAGLPDGEVRDGIYELVSRAAVTALPRTAEAEAVCDNVDVWRVHRGHRARLDACRDLLSVTRNHLERVRDDGRSAFVDGTARANLQRSCVVP